MARHAAGHDFGRATALRRRLRSPHRPGASMAALISLVCLSCTEEPSRPMLTRDELLDPESCKDCHPRHYTEWSASMHAYALEDPVFEAMNTRGQEETDGELGQFCVNCHAPMAVREGAFADDFADLEQVPKQLRGVTCYFCHQVSDVERPHNAGLTLADDGVMRGGIRNPVQPWAHKAEYSELHDRRSTKSSEVCGACHDIVTPAGVELERTYKEYLTTVVSRPGDGFNSCQTCHMRSSEGSEVVAIYPDVPARTRRSHLFPAVDVPLTPFPGREAMVAAVTEFALPQSLGYFALVPGSGDGLQITLELETQAGHAQPSGAAQDRRMWLEIRAFNEDGSVRFESGVIGDDDIEEVPPGEPGHDPYLCIWRDRLYDTADPDDPDAREVHMFWEARSYRPRLVPPPTNATPGGHTSFCEYNVANPADVSDRSRPARIEIRVRIRPMGQDVLTDLVASGHLDERIRDEMPTFTLFEAVATPDLRSPADYVVTENRVPIDETRYLCLLHGDEHCQ